MSVLQQLFGRVKQSEEEKERHRRNEVNEKGRLTDGTIHEVVGTVVYYSYSVRGVTYEASQDLAGLPNVKEQDLSHFVGPVAVKYLPENPANSIVASENWSGIPIGNTRKQEED